METNFEEVSALNVAIDKALLEGKSNRGRKPFTPEFKQYIAYRSIMDDLNAERERIKLNIALYGIAMFGKYAKSNKHNLANAAEKIIGYGC